MKPKEIIVPKQLKVYLLDIKINKLKVGKYTFKMPMISIINLFQQMITTFLPQQKIVISFLIIIRETLSNLD